MKMYNSVEDNSFHSIGEFVDCLIRGGEVVFVWKNIKYGLFGDDRGFCFAHIDGSSEKWFDTLDLLLDHCFNGDRLRDVITQVEVLDRTI
ncbi:MAG: hypothetical protein J6I98_06795 [Clostridia bacterium]|nr:hypothetical protein [Clostridia bacterium]